MSDPLIRLFWRMKEWWEEGADEDAERAICRAAAEISGLTPAFAAALADYLEGNDAAVLALFAMDNHLRRYAELAAEDD